MSDFNDAIPEIRWYVVHTFTGYENKVKANLEKIIENRALQDEIVDIIIPVEIRVDGEKEYEAKLMPSYVLVKMLMNDANWHVVRNITGVTGFVGPGSKPVPLTDEEAAAIIKDEPSVTVAEPFVIGDTVIITDGPFRDFTGRVDSIDDSTGKVTIIVPSVGRDVRVEADKSALKKVNE
jgi:transcriptional antiterminator NusG